MSLNNISSETAVEKSDFVLFLFQNTEKHTAFGQYQSSICLVQCLVSDSSWNTVSW